MKANQATHPVRVMCRLLKVSKSGFYAWDGRPLSARAREDIGLTAKIHAIHRRSRGAYGAPMIHAELADEHAVHVGRKRVARLMRSAGLRGVYAARFVRTTQVDPAADRATDLVDRQFAARRPRSAVGGRHHLRADLGGVPVPGDRARCLVAAHRRLDDGYAPADRAGARRARTWRSRNAGPTASSTTPTRAASTRATRSASAARKWA